MNWKSISFDWNRTRAFLATAELGSLSAAAKSLNVTQPTLSRQVAALEEELGISLFERSTQKLKLSPSGIELLSIAREMGDIAHKFSMAANGQSEVLEGIVVISACQLDAIYRLPPILSKLRQEEPKISIELVVTNEVSDLKRRDADIAIRSFQPTQPSLVAKKIGYEKVYLYGTREYLQPFDDVKTTADMQDMQIIGFGNNGLIIKQFSEYGWELSENNFKISTEFQPTQLELCKHHLGLIYLPEDIANQEPQLMRALEDLSPELHIPMWLVCHQELRTNLRTRRVFDFLASELREATSA
ncbi:Transcription regulator LysR family [Vibrio coralliirubri]|uniref:LysR family transcriptional regulator n=1 Tax=Vibrio coralliirubri TaxID=1516159 RepID=UPI00062FE1BB|nr:LysR family transcriptional regulator [Vibrio coralliirubri]CDT33724.1 Transcription regulator LysR family [Vibrio coralliirubri]